MPKKTPTSMIPAERIEGMVYALRGRRVMIDADLAALYETETRSVNQAVRRNLERFPEEFVFRLTAEEWQSLRSQIGISNEGRGGRRSAPLVFTEHGAVMLATVLNSPRAVRASIEIVRAFVRLRALMTTHADLAKKIAELEARYDGQFRKVFEALRFLIEPPAEPKPRIGFETRPKR